MERTRIRSHAQGIHLFDPECQVCTHFSRWTDLGFEPTMPFERAWKRGRAITQSGR